VILFTPGAIAGIFRVSAAGSPPAVVTRLGSEQGGHVVPQFLPDGRHFLYFVIGGPDVRGVYIGQLDGPETRRLFDADAPAVFSPSGHLLFVRQGTLYAQNFDAARLEVTGNPVRVAEQVLTQVIGVALSASATGTIIYRTGTGRGTTVPIHLDRSVWERDRESG